MKTNLYVVYDRVAEESGPVFEAKNDGVALRRFSMLMQENSSKGLIPEDFRLLKVGEIDHSTSLVIPTDIPEIVDTVHQFKEKEVEIDQ